MVTNDHNSPLSAGLHDIGRTPKDSKAALDRRHSSCALPQQGLGAATGNKLQVSSNVTIFTAVKISCKP